MGRPRGSRTGRVTGLGRFRAVGCRASQMRQRSAFPWSAFAGGPAVTFGPTQEHTALQPQNPQYPNQPQYVYVQPPQAPQKNWWNRQGCLVKSLVIIGALILVGGVLNL